ncbi:MAG: gfo/Idh/MocA family oxidoreductase [Ignavibacteriales bacterium]|nr:MAG: gfo/Idh/MocA family oxidoreductase [Ignavibacteriales bacterium]
MKKEIGFGLIGSGGWGDVHARTLSQSANSKLVAICDLNLEQAKQSAAKYNISSVYNNVNEMLGDKDIDAVSIATPDFTHTELIIAALEAGKHVMVEKPMATTVEDCNRIISLRDKMGIKLMVNYSNRWKTPFIHVKKLISSGELGNLQLVNIKLNDTIFVPTKMLSWASQSNSLHFLGTHLVDLLRWVSGAEVNRVYSVSRSNLLKGMGIDTPDYFQSLLELNNGGTVYMENCWIIAESAPSVYEFKAEFIGSKTTVKVDISHHRMIEKYSPEGTAMLDVGEQYDLDGNPQGQVSIQHFIDCLINDKNPLVTAEDGLEATKVIVALEKSAQTKQPINL